MNPQKKKTPLKLNYNRWTVIGELVSLGARKGKQAPCRCECGKESLVSLYSLKNGYSKSCGCFRAFAASKRFKHRKSGTRVWNCWNAIRQRCFNENSTSYKHYGAKGIIVCSRWLVFNNFYADMGEMPKGKSIGRINNKGNYEPSNCRWETQGEQNRNYSRNHLLTHNNKTLCMQQWSEITGIKASTIRARINVYRWPVSKALTLF